MAIQVPHRSVGSQGKPYCGDRPSDSAYSFVCMDTIKDATKKEVGC